MEISLSIPFMPTLLPAPKLVPRLWYTVNFCGKINGDGVERMARGAPPDHGGPFAAPIIAKEISRGRAITN
jgi:hypothetical protein